MTEKSYRIHIRHGEFELDIEGDQAFVESYLEAFLSEGDIEPPPPPKARSAGRSLSGAKTRRSPKKDGPRKGKYEVPEIDKKALSTFMGRTKPNSNKARYLAYLQFWKGQGLNEVADAHIHACFLAQGLPVPPTGRQHFRSLQEEGLVAPGSRRGLWALTEEGERASVPTGRVRTGRRPNRPAGKSAKAKGPKPARRKARRSRPSGSPGKPAKAPVRRKGGKPPAKPAEVQEAE